MYQAQTSLGGEEGTGWSTKNVDLWGLWGGGDASALVPPPLTGLMKFINGKDNGNGPYFPSATRNNTSTNKAVTGVALILPPPPPASASSPSVRHFTGILSYTEKK